MTFEMYKKGSKYIDELIQVVEVPFEDAIDGDVFKQNDWIDLKSDIEDSNLIIVEIQVRMRYQLLQCGICAQCGMMKLEYQLLTRVLRLYAVVLALRSRRKR